MHAGDDLPPLAEAARVWVLLIYEDFRPMLPLVNEVGGDDVRTSLKYSFAAAAAIWGERPSLDAYIQGWARSRTALLASCRLLRVTRRLGKAVGRPPLLG
ncbi:hypothetical protein ACWFRJ_00125 [Streptomyces sp. NPDC055239]